MSSVLLYLTRQMSAIVRVSQPFVACSVSPSLSVRQPSDGTGQERQLCGALRSPHSEAKSCEIWETRYSSSPFYARSRFTHRKQQPTPLRQWDQQAATEGVAFESAVA